MNLEGNWICYHEDLVRLAEKYKPVNVLELGCGFFIGLDAMASAGSLQKYVGVDWRPYTGEVEKVQAKYPNVNITVHRANVHDLPPLDGPFDMILIDAHDGPDEQWRLDTDAQIAYAIPYNARVIVVDDCCVKGVETSVLEHLGTPTGKSSGATGVWWWER